MSPPAYFGSLDSLRNQPLHVFQNQVQSAVLNGISFVGPNDHTSGSQTMGRDPLVGRERNFGRSRKSFKI